MFIRKCRVYFVAKVILHLFPDFLVWTKGKI